MEIEYNEKYLTIEDPEEEKKRLWWDNFMYCEKKYHLPKVTIPKLKKLYKFLPEAFWSRVGPAINHSSYKDSNTSEYYALLDQLSYHIFNYMIDAALIKI